MKNGVSACDLPVDEVDGGGRGLVVDGLHALAGQRAGVLDGAVGGGLDDAARAELLAEGRVLRVVEVLRLLLGVQVVEVAEELVEAVGGRQELVLVAEVVLAELAGGVAQVLERRGDGDVARLQADVGAGQADLGEAGAERRLAGDEGRAAGGAALLGVVVGEDRALLADPVDVGRAVAHQALGVDRQVGLADVVAEDDEDVGLLRRLLRDGHAADGQAQQRGRAECFQHL